MASLADLQRAPGAPAPAAPPGLNLDVDNVRTFDTPEFAGMTFLEVTAKTALNKVTGMPFPYSINPYRGCSHACSYCFARPTHSYLNLSPLRDFENTVVVKTNLSRCCGGRWCAGAGGASMWRWAPTPIPTNAVRGGID